MAHINVGNPRAMTAVDTGLRPPKDPTNKAALKEGGLFVNLPDRVLGVGTGGGDFIESLLIKPGDEVTKPYLNGLRGKVIYASQQASLASAFADVQEGSVLDLGARSYDVTETVGTDFGCSILGEGMGATRIRKIGGGDGVRLELDSYFRRVNIRDLRFETTSVNNGVGLNIIRVPGLSSLEAGPVLENIEFAGEDVNQNSWGVCLGLDYGWNSILNNVQFRGKISSFSGTGLLMTGQSTPVTMRHCRGFELDKFVYSPGGARGSEGFIADKCQVVACRDAYIFEDSRAYPLLEITGGHANVSRYGARIVGRPQVKIRDWTVYRWFSATDGSGSGAPNNETFVGIQVEGQMVGDVTYGSDDFSVNGSSFNGYVNSGGSGTKTGIVLATSSDCGIDNNSFIDLQDGVALVNTGAAVTNNKYRNVTGDLIPNKPPGTYIFANYHIKSW